MQDIDVGLRRDIQPYVPAAFAPLAQHAGVLTCHSHEAEISDGRPVRLRVPVEDYDALAAPRGRKRMTEADDPRTDNCKVVHQQATMAEKRS